MSAPMLFFGIGSPQGDDQVGWLVAQTLSRRALADLEVRTASTPADLLEPSSNRECLIVCDACRSSYPIGTIHRLVWPSSRFLQLQWSSTHDLDLPGILQLASKLRWLPDRVIVWAIEIGSASLGTPVSDSMRRLVESIADHIIHSLDTDENKVIPTIGRASHA